MQWLQHCCCEESLSLPPLSPPKKKNHGKLITDKESKVVDCTDDTHPSFGHCSPVADGEQGHTRLAFIMYTVRAGCPNVFQFASGVNF